MEPTLWDKFLDFIHWYSISRFFTYWVYPGYSLTNLLFHRHDRIKIPQVKPWEYSDVEYLMLCANMELIVKFIEQEKAEDAVLWYKDEDGNDAGHKYGEWKDQQIIYPQLKGKWVMDIIKEIYNWWKVEYPTLQDEHDYILGYWCDYLLGETVFKKVLGKKDLYEMGFDKTNTIKFVEQLKQIEGLKWDILTKYIPEDKLCDEEFVSGVMKDIETTIYNKHQYYLHLCIEVRPSLWT